MDWKDFDVVIAALCAWKEARGEGHDGMRAVVHVIANRAQLQNKSWAQIVYAPLQFTSMTYRSDPQLGLVPKQPDPAFEDALNIAEYVQGGSDPDLTGGATHYFNPELVLPSWAATMVKTATIGHHDFYKEA